MAGILLLTLLRSQLQRFTSGFSRAIAVKPITFARRYFEAMRANAGAVTSMNNEWIANLAQDIKQKSHEAAEEYGRSQHRAGIVATEGRPFFTAFALCLEEDLNEVKRLLQGDVTASDTIVQSKGPSEIKLTRSRFPWFDADIFHRDSTVVLDYAKGLGIAGDPALDRKSSHFEFHVDDDDTLSIKEAFGDHPKQFYEPAELARHIIQLLFEV